jgi:hypothetical protein
MSVTHKHNPLMRWLPALGLSIVAPLAAAQVNWVPASGGDAPKNTINANTKGQPRMPICRGWYQNGTHPGKLVGKNCNIAWGEQEITLPQYEVLAGKATGLSWVYGARGSMPKRPFYGGEEPGRQLAVCRSNYNGAMHAGKLVSNGCQLGWGGKAVLLDTYQVMAFVDGPRQARNNGTYAPQGLSPIQSPLSHLPGPPIVPPQYQQRGVPEYGAGLPEFGAR